MTNSSPEDKSISIPPDALTDPEAREMLRAWVAHEGLHCSLNIGQWGEREAAGWGVLLSDVACCESDDRSRYDLDATRGEPAFEPLMSSRATS